MSECCDDLDLNPSKGFGNSRDSPDRTNCYLTGWSANLCARSEERSVLCPFWFFWFSLFSSYTSPSWLRPAASHRAVLCHRHLPWHPTSPAQSVPLPSALCPLLLGLLGLPEGPSGATPAVNYLPIPTPLPNFWLSLSTYFLDPSIYSFFWDFFGVGCFLNILGAVLSCRASAFPGCSGRGLLSGCGAPASLCGDFCCGAQAQ